RAQLRRYFETLPGDCGSTRRQPTVAYTSSEVCAPGQARMPAAPLLACASNGGERLARWPYWRQAKPESRGPAMQPHFLRLPYLSFSKNHRLALSKVQGALRLCAFA